MIDPPRWTDQELTEQSALSVRRFQTERLEEDLSKYGDYFDECQTQFMDLLEQTLDLSELEANAAAILADKKLLASFRYVSGPPISADDLKVVADAVLSKARLLADEDMRQRVVQVIMAGLDRRRFPWVLEGKRPSDAEKQAAVIASAALMANQRLQTQRRNEGSREQETAVCEQLQAIGFREVRAVEMKVIGDTPRPGEFCREAMLAGRKADITVGLYDRRAMPIECKVSNSAVNSKKRLNNDAAVKAVHWRRDLGEVNVVPAAVLSGVYTLSNLRSAQDRGLTLFWAHDLAQLVDFINRTKPAPRRGKK
ncbi:MAG: XamI family restriction endonuclease [Gemmataceae bacterium]|nr:XamI family restriction endonuclease [Gemmataceae bacterium]